MRSPRPFPRTGFLGLGTADFGGRAEHPDDVESTAIVHRALDRGIRVVDTAPWYGRGLAERRLGQALAGLSGPLRDELWLNTKVGRVLRPSTTAEPPWIHGAAAEVLFDYTADGLQRSLDDSLLRLGVGAVDSAVVHDLDGNFHSAAELERHASSLAGSGWAGLQEWRSTGVIGAIGVGVNATGLIPWFLRTIGTPDFFLVAMPYTLADQGGLAELELCRDLGIDVVIGAPFASGLLAGSASTRRTYAYRLPDETVVAHVTAIERCCADHDVSIRAAALQFVLAHPAVVGVVAGAATVAHVDDLVAAFEERIPREFWAELGSQALVDPRAPIPDQEDKT